MAPHEIRPDDHEGEPSNDKDEEILEVDLSDEADDTDVLVVELDDEPLPAALPPVDSATLASAQALEVPAVCARTGAGFVITVLPRPDGYDVVGARRADFKAAAPSGGQTLKGVFHLTQYPGCPHCGAKGLILCGECGAVSCSATDPNSGMPLPCPVCGNAGPIGESKKGWSVKAFAGKGKKGGKAEL